MIYVGLSPMRTLTEFVAESAQHHEGINPFFELGMYSLIKDVEALVNALQSAGVRFEVIGGVAVNAHIFFSHRSRSFVTRDIDVLLHRDDLARVTQAVQPLGYEAKKIMGGYTLIRRDQDLAEAIHLIFVGEKSKTIQPYPHPELHPELKNLFGVSIPVASLQDLLHMKLNSLRPKDLIHLETLDEAGLITPALEQALPQILQNRLKQARDLIAANKPDIEG